MYLHWESEAGCVIICLVSSSSSWKHHPQAAGSSFLQLPRALGHDRSLGSVTCGLVVSASGTNAVLREQMRGVPSAASCSSRGSLETVPDYNAVVKKIDLEFSF